MSLSRLREEDDDEIVAEINVTPLTDIFLVLLIIFMVTSTALVQQGTPVDLPRAGRGSAAAAAVIVTATTDHRIEVDGQPVAWGELQQALEAALHRVGEQAVVLRGDRRIILDDAVRIMVAAKQAGARKIAIATEPEAGDTTAAAVSP